MTKSIENRLYLKKKLFRFQYREGISISIHLNAYNKILADLQNLDVAIEDEDKALLLLNSLPDTYNHLITTLLYGKDEICFKNVSSSLINNEYSKKAKENFNDTFSNTLTVKGRSHSKLAGVRVNPAKDKCAYCHEKRQWKKDCPSLKGKKNVVSKVNVA
ncbi:hypothetical protein ACSBR2_015150 [Camellia fascicularis]